MARTNNRSAKDLWSLVTGSSILNCKELVKYEIERNSDHIVNGVLYFKKANDASLDTLKKSVDDPLFEFLSKLSKLINVDALQSHDLFLSYTQYDFKGTQKTLEAHLINERLAQALLHEMWHYYYSERLYYMLILKHILSHWQDDSDPYKDIYESFLEKYNKDNAVISKVITQMEDSINSELPSKESHGTYMTDLLAYHWVTYTLKEQGELLQLLLLYYKVIEHTVEDVEKMFSLFQSHGFGLRQSFRMVSSEDTKHLVDSIGYLESFVLIQCFELEFLFKCKDRGMIADHYLLKNEKALKSLTASILRLGSHQSHSPILMAWLLIAHSSANPDLVAHCSKLGKIALHLNVFDYLASSLTANVFSSTGIISEISNNIVYNLLSAILSLFELQYLGSIKPLFDITKETLQHPLVANDFWKKGEDSGIRELFNYYAEMFPLEFCPVLDLCASLSLANKESCQKVVELLKCIPVYAEYLENEHDVANTQEQNVLQLTNNRILFGDSTLVIPRGTYGLVTKDKDKEGCSIIQWKVLLNGWQICLRGMYLLLQENSFNSVLSSQENIMKMTSVAKLVDNILKMDVQMSYNFTHLINILFSFLQRCINTTSPPLEFISICINIAASLSKDEISDVWRQLAQIRLLPFLSHTPKNTLDLIGSSCMNVSIIGQLIASKECVSGDYSVCISFLNLVSNISQTLSKEDETFIACITYILREIFSSFHKWYFVDPHQRILIGQKCLNLLHNLLSVDSKRSKAIEKSQDLCIFSLLNLEAGQTLLKIVCTGEEVIQQTILKQNSESGDQIATMIRLSLSVLNRLLLMRNRISSNSKTEVSPLVSVLFSTPGHTNQPQVVLMVAHYVFQRYNPRLATLAVQLLKRFAKEFPMSLLGCFSSEAEAIRDHFLARLSSPFEDIRLKVSILEFLTVCVAQQPGLIEMFINVKSKQEKPSKDEEPKSCLECVKNILKDKMNEAGDFPPDLLCAAVEFIHALWAGHQALAMEALKEDQQFWNLTCNSILNNESLLDAPGINAYIIRTLALEIFYSGRNNLHQLVQNILKSIQEKKLMLKWSEHIHSPQKRSDAAEGTSMELDSLASPSSQDLFSLLTAWRDFLLVTVVYEPVLLSSDSKKQILKDILRQFTSELAGSHQRILILLSELFLMLSRHWQREFIAFVKEEEYNPIYEIISEVASHSDTIHLREQLVVISLAVFTIRIFSKFNDKIKNIKEWISPCCQLLKTSSQLIHRSVDPKHVEGFLKLPTVIVILLNELVQEVKDWLPILKNHSILPLLVSLLIKCLKFNVGLELSHSIIVLFLSMSSDKKAAEAICNSGFMSELTLILSNIDFEKEISERRKGTLSQKLKVNRIDVYYAFLRFITVLLKVLGNYFLTDCWNFIGVHQDLMHLSLVKVKTSLRLEDIQEAIFTSNFILQLSTHREAWKLEHPKSLNLLLVDICNCLYGTIAILNKPELLKYYIMKKVPDTKLTSFSDMDTENLLKRGSSEDESQLPAEVSEVQEKLYELLGVTLTTLNKFSPELYETLSGNPYDYAQWQLLLSINFSVPSLDRDGPLGFGCLLACINMCLKQFVKNEKTPSPRKVMETLSQLHRPVIMYILEISLTLLISQANIAMFHPDLHLRDKQIIKRELAPELNSMNITMNRYLRRGPPSPVAMTTLTTPSPMKSQSVIEHPFLRFIGNLIEKLFK